MLELHFFNDNLFAPDLHAECVIYSYIKFLQNQLGNAYSLSVSPFNKLYFYIYISSPANVYTLYIIPKTNASPEIIFLKRHT